MAKKRLNKKVALIGFLVFVVFALAATATILYLSRDPAKYAKDGDVAFAAKNYKVAEHSYLKARALSKNDDFRVKMLFKLVGVFIETDKWRNVLGCWNEIIRLEPKEVKARYGQLRYFYTMANAGVNKNLWSDIDLQASQFIEVVESQNLLDEDVSKWETAGLPKNELAASRAGSYLYLVRGRALLEKARLGAVTDPEELFPRSISDLEKVLQLEPNNVDAYWYLAQAHIARGEVYASKGNLEAKTKALEDAKELLEKPIKAGAGNLQAHINLLAMKPVIAQMSDREQFKALEPEYLALVEKFNSDAKAHSVLSIFYLNTGYKNFDKAIAQIEKAVELDKGNIEYAVSAASLYYRKFSIFGDKDALNKAIAIAKDALQLPGAKETKGPEQWINKRNRVGLNSLLARSYIEQIFGSSGPMTDAQKQELLADAEKAVHEIEQLYGSGEDPTVVKWQGMLELARGNRDAAIRKLVPTYEQIKASGQRDSQLAYTLAKLFENSEELGSAKDFLENALSITDRNVPDKIDDSKPDALLDYAALLMKLRAYDAAVNMVDYFENEYWVKPRSHALRMEAYIGARKFDEVQKELAKENPEDPNTIRLNISLTKAKMEQIRASIMRRRMAESSDILQQLMKKESTASTGVELQVQNEANSAVSLKAMSGELYGYADSLSQLTGKLLSVEPNSVNDTAVTLVCDNYMSLAKWNDARILVGKYLEHFPHNTTVLVYKRILSEPEPNSISNQRRRQIEQEVIAEISDPVAKSMYLGAYFQRNGEPNKAVEEYKKVLGITPLKEKATNEPVFGTVENPTEIHRMAASSLADIAFRARDLKLAEQIADVGKRGNLDGCDGQFFAALVLLIKQDYKAALISVDACLKLRPVFSYAYMLRSNINSLLANETASIADIQKAASMNPLDGTIAKVQANILFQRNRKLGDNATSEQVIEAKSAIDKAMALNSNDMQLLGFYAEYISDTDPMRALAIRQMLQKTVPSAENAFQLGRMAMKVAEKQTDNAQKEALYAIAESSFQQALVYEPANRMMLEGMAAYYRATDQEKKAEDLLTKSQDPKLLWRHFVLAGQLDKAKQLLLQLYAKEPNNKDTLTGLLSIAQSSSDRQAASKYSDELIKIEDSPETRLLQIQVFLMTGLIKEAESKLQSFKEKYPNDPRGMQLGGWLAMKQGRLPEALKLINKYLELNQDNADVWQLRGEINYLMANYDQAVADFKKSKGLADKPSVRIALAKGLLRIGRGEDALTELENVLDDPKAPVEGALLLEEVYSKVGKRNLLVDMYRKVLKNYPDNLLWYDRAGKYALSVNDFNSAVALYEKGWQKSSETDKDMLDGYLQALLASNKTDKAMEVAGKYVDSNNVAIVALYRIAEVKMKLGNKTEAIQYCRKAVEKTSKDENASSWILEKMSSLLGQEEVLNVCKEKLQAKPNSPSANFAMFNVMKLNGEYNKALEYIDKCVGFVTPGSDSEIELKMRKVEVLQLAYMKTSDNNYRHSAIKEYESLLTKVPNNVDILNNLAYMLAEANEQLGEALNYAKRAHEALPNDAGYMDTYAYVLYKNKKYSEAAELSHASVQQYEQEKATVPYDVYEHLGMIKQSLGQKDESLNAYKQALEAGGNTLPNAAKERINAAIEQVSN